jgi:hypothetical protein
MLYRVGASTSGIHPPPHCNTEMCIESAFWFITEPISIQFWHSIDVYYRDLYDGPNDAGRCCSVLPSNAPKAIRRPHVGIVQRESVTER